MEVTEALRCHEQTQLLLCFTKPYKPVSRDTIHRWLKTVLIKSGIDTSISSAYSTRAASVSAAKAKDTPMDVIPSTGGWANTLTFSTYYNKTIVNQSNSDFATNVLNHGD